MQRLAFVCRLVSITASMALSSGSLTPADGASRAPSLPQPETTLTSVPPPVSLSSTADFAFTATETGSTFACSLDGGAFTVCVSPKSYTGLTNGHHNFLVQATDAANNTDPTPASYSWTIDLGTDYQVLHYFAFSSDASQGGFSEAPLIQGRDGFLYGTTAGGGAFYAGTFFRIDLSGNFLLLHSFDNYAQPSGRLIQASDGNFYGTTLQGGRVNGGTIYKFDTAGNFTQLHEFDYYTEGGLPRAGLTQGSDGYFYGTTWSGGAGTRGTVFRMDGAGNVTVLHTLPWDAGEGSNPWTTLTEGADGNFYGTTEVGAVFNAGTVFQVTPSGALTVLHTFDGAEGGNPIGGLVLASDGNFYGTTTNSLNGGGTIYRIDSAGHFAVMHSFDVNNDGAWPWGELIQGSDGNIYGVAHTGGQFGGGTVYRMDHGGNVTVLHNFGTGYDGSAPPAGVIQGSDGALYGTTEQGPGYGNFRSGGVIFRLDVGLSPGDQAPAITSASTTTFTVGSAGTFSVTTTGTPTVVAITETGALPSGVTFTNNRNGTATLSGTSAAGTSGTYALTITAENGRLPNATQPFTLTVSRASQTITVTQAPPATALFNATFSVAATASSGLPVAIGASGACSVSVGTVTMTSGTGICTVTFEQAGDVNYAVAPQVMYSTTAQKAMPTVSLTGGTFPFDGASHGAIGFAYGVGGIGDILSPIVTFSYVGTGSTTYGPTSTPPMTVGTYNATAFFVGDTNYTSASNTAVISITTPPWGSFAQVSAGLYHTCAIQSDGAVACWGDSSLGQATPPAGTFTQISAGYWHTCGVRSDGTLACWGDNTYRQATPPTGLYRQVSAGALHSCGLKDDGTVTCWGDNSFGEATPPSGTFTDISAALGYPTCGVRTGDTVSCWGPNYGTPPAGTYTQVSAGNWFACGLKDDGTVSCWGSIGLYGPTPSGTFTQVDAGLIHACALQTNGAVVCWGDNTASQATPPLGGFSQVSAGGYHSCGIEANRTLTCWGDNTYGQSAPPVVSQAPTVTSASSTTFTVGSVGTFTVTTSGTPTVATITETGTLPTGVSFIDNGNGTAMLSGTPAAGTAGTYQFTITASNGVLPNATQSFTLTVNQAPAITSANGTTFTAGTAGRFTVTTSGSPTVGTITETGGLPAGVTFTDNGNGTATLSGTAATGGPWQFTITASNGVLPNATQSFTLTVNQGNQTITVTHAPPASARYNTSFTVAATATSGLAVSYSSGSPDVCTTLGAIFTNGGAFRSVGATFTMVSGTGSCVIQYEQMGDATYAAAPQVSNSTTATKASQTITVTQTAPANAVINTSFTVAATATSRLPVSYGSGSPNVCTNVGATFMIVSGTGTCVVQYNQAGDANYMAGVQVTNSTTATASAMADLVIISAAVINPPSMPAAPGSSFSVQDTVKNQGTAAAGSSTTRYYLSLNTNKGSDDILLSETSSVGKLAAGAIAFSGTVAVMIPSTTPGGTYYLLACANDTTKVKESNETNNCVASTTQLDVIR